MPRGGECAQIVVGMLYNAFGLCIWCVVVCGHCVSDVIYISVMFCLLVASFGSGFCGCCKVAFFFLCVCAF